MSATELPGPFGPVNPPMRGRYLMHKARNARAMALVDGLLSLVPRRWHEPPADLERILVSNWAHLGDVITSFGVLAALRERYPRARIGMVVGSWGKAAIDKVGLADDIHVVDHWMLNRSALPKAEKWSRYRETRARALCEIRAARYQVAIDLFPQFPPAHPLFYRAGIPVRAGYVSGGLGPLLTHPVPWSSDEARPMADQYRDLLDALTPDRPFAPAVFRPRRDSGTLPALPAELATVGPYVVLHPGAGSPSRLWGHERWHRLVSLLQQEQPSRCLVLTGAGAAETDAADRLAAGFAGIVNMAGRADWETFMGILARADLVVCPDTVTGHAAALFTVPTVSIFTGTNSPGRWGPYNDRARLVMRPVICAPCNTPGCETMACFRGVSPEEVLDAVLAALANRRPA